MDSGGLNVPVPNTPVPDGTSNGEIGSGLELIGQEVVIHRTLRQSSNQSNAAPLPIVEATTTPARTMVPSIAALADRSERGEMSGQGRNASERQETQLMTHPKGSPVVLGPGSTGQRSLPLFDQDQLRRLHELQSQAPMLYSEGVRRQLTMEDSVRRPSFLPPQEDARMAPLGVGAHQNPQVMLTPEMQGFPMDVFRQLEDLRNRINQLNRENQDTKEFNQVLRRENETLKSRLSFYDGQTGAQIYVTPDQKSERDHNHLGSHFTDGAEALKNVQVLEGNGAFENAQVPVGNGVFENVQVSENVQVPDGNEAFENVRMPENVKVPEYNHENFGKRNVETEETYGNDPKRMKEGQSVGSSQTQPDVIQLMAKMMEGMTNLQKQIMEGKDHESENVRSNLELPPLPEWSAQTGPVDLSDWLWVVEPLMADLSSSSSEWWALIIKEAQAWYEAHLRLQPLDRVSHEAHASPALSLPKWTRLERRASSMLLMSMSSNLREEMVSTKRVSVLRIICHLMLLYQPGGLAEKELILRQLETPQECSSLSEAVQGLRRWSRWRRRASDLGVQEPDPFLLLKGLNRLTRKPLEQHRDLSFRISLARSTLQVDSTPTSRSVTSFALHLIAEFE